MANSLTSNLVRNVAKEFTEGFESQIVMAKTLNTEIIKGYPNPGSGETVKVRRYHQYRNVPTSDGDITNETWNSILSGYAPATVQNWITVPLTFNSMEEATQLDSMKKIVAPAVTRVVTSLELVVADFLLKNMGLSYGNPGTLISKWSDIAGCDSFMDELGIPATERFYVHNAFVKQLIADSQSGLTSPGLVNTAWEKAMTSRRVGGMQMLPSSALKTRTNGACADRVGAVSSAPDATYATAKDTMTQTLALSGLTTLGIVEEGEILEYSTVYQTNPDTGEVIYGVDGEPLKFRQTVTAGTTASGGALSLTVTPAGLYETNGQYNNISKAIPQSEVVTILGATGATSKPALFYTKDVATLATVDLPKLFSTDTKIETESGFSMRVSLYSDGDASVQKMRVDLVPVLGILNPLLGGQSFGVAT